MTAAKSDTAAEMAATVLIEGPVVRLAPAPDRIVRKPDGSRLAEAGEEVRIDGDWIFWARRADDGDVVIAPAPASGEKS